MGRLTLRGKSLLVRGNLDVSSDANVVNDFAWGTTVDGGEVNSIATVSTTDATKKTVASIALNKNECAIVEVIAFGKQPDGTKKLYAGGIVATYNRDGSGNVTAFLDNGALFTADNTGTWGGISTEANTTDQTIDICVTGKATTNIKWLVKYKYSIFAHSV